MVANRWTGFCTRQPFGELDDSLLHAGTMRSMALRIAKMYEMGGSLVGSFLNGLKDMFQENAHLIARLGVGRETVDDGICLENSIGNVLGRVYISDLVDYSVVICSFLKKRFGLFLVSHKRNHLKLKIISSLDGCSWRQWLVRPWPGHTDPMHQRRVD